MSNRFAVLGNPIEHSLSPFIHQYFANQAGIELIYEKIQIVEGFETFVTDFFKKGGKGLNITLPYKQQAFALAECTTPRCKQAKAANTLWFKNNQLYADNTDGEGLLRDLALYIHLQGKKILILGAGGAARGILGPLIENNELTLSNRTLENALRLQKEFPAIEISSLDNLTQSFDLIINATSASLMSTALNLSPSILKKTSLCYDLAYDIKQDTAFVQWARQQGVKAFDGLGMLVEQAALSFFIWHGFKPITDRLKTILRK